jgi:hypothetical protein
LLPFLAQTAYGMQPQGGGALPQPGHDADRTVYERALTRARDRALKIRAKRGSSPESEHPDPLLQWPVRKAIGVTDPAIEAISNFVDQDASEAGLLDFDCGDRTYDGHRGLDVYIAPFSWYKMERDEGIVVAAAGGTIVDKVGDQPERSCVIGDSSDGNNLVVIQQDNGALALYAHMRTGSLTAKPVGATVTVGEYLGVIGSSGNSSGPHLHFEVGFWELEGSQQVWKHRDPFAGACNATNLDSWWAQQPPYYDSMLLDIATHSAPPERPECPTTEIPNYSDNFSAGETLYLAIYLRDQLRNQQASLAIRRPNGSVFTTWNFAEEAVEHYASSYWWWGVDLPGNAPAGEWTFTVEFEGQTQVHSFWVDDSPEPIPNLPDTNNAYNGLWYDSLLEGEGYNIVTTSVGTVIYFYGSDSDGERFWLISELVRAPFVDGEQSTIVMYESTGGTHAAPIPSARGLSVWGELRLTFTDCDNGTAILEGIDGSKTSAIAKLAGVPGSFCVSGEPAADSPFAGLWFDTALEGEGFNAIVTAFGTVIYYYGFDADGNRLWMIAGPIDQTLQTGAQVTVDILKATAGTFAQPVPSEQALEVWGSLTIQVNSCTSITMTTDTADGLKISDTVSLARVVGMAEC